MISLSANQSEIVNAPLHSAIQVLASAGSGKTRVLTERVRYIIQNTKKDCVLALTFTNKAAEEMTHRLTDCEQVEERAWIATIHSVAQRILESYGHTIGLPSELHIYDREKDKMDVFIQSLREAGVNIDEYLNVTSSSELKNREANLKKFMEIFSTIKRDFLTKSEVVEIYKSEDIWKIFQDYQNSLINSGGIDYEDILNYAHRILMTHDWIAKIYRSKYKHVCVDEAQDLNKAQYEFIKSFCGCTIQSVLMVGDPNQMIYGFNGSSHDYLCINFIQDFNPLRFSLKENYRSTKSIIKASNKLRPASQVETEYALEGMVSFKEFNTEHDEANSIAEKINELLNLRFHPEIEGEISLEKMVIIARNRFVFKTLEESLKEKGIPFSLRKGERQLEPITKFGKTLDYALRIKINPKNWIDGKKLCQILEVPEPDEWNSMTLSNISNNISNNCRAELLVINKIISLVEDLNIEEPNLPKLFKELREALEKLAREKNDNSCIVLEDIELGLEELSEFIKAWTNFRLKGLGSSLVAFRNALALGQLTQHTVDNSLTLSTVHTMKGLEKDIVFLMGMCDGVFPDYRAKTEKEIDEERNSAFVAVTRAKRWLYVSNPKQRVMPWGSTRFQSKSCFVVEMES